MFQFIICTIYVYGQGTESNSRNVEFGAIIFTYQENLVGTGWASPHYVQKYIPQKSYGVFFKVYKRKYNLRASFKHFRYHNKYELSKLIDVEDYDETVDGDYLRNTIFLGVEKQFLKTKLTPYLFTDIGIFYSRYSGTKDEFSGWTLETYHFDFLAKGFGLQLEPGAGVKMSVNSWIGLILESSISFEKLLWKEDDRFSLTGDDIKFNPINKLGIVFKL